MSSQTQPLLSQEARQELRDALCDANDAFILALPKVELHVHLEGTLTADRRWQLAQKHGIEVRLGRGLRPVANLEDLRVAYSDVISSAQLPSFTSCDPTQIPATFFEAYYSGFEVFKCADDFYDVAMDYFKYARSVNIQYCEIFFDPQAHTARGVTWEEIMSGLRKAQEAAVVLYGIKSQWIMCFLRDRSVESAWEHYTAALNYRGMIAGFGLDSNEFENPPSRFDDLFARALADGFNITAHCDVGVKNTHEHIFHVATRLGGPGAHRIDHGLNAADRSELIEAIKSRSTLMTICPWAYLRRETYQDITRRIRTLLDAGVKICISSDSPAYMDHSFLLPNLLLVKKMCQLSNSDVTDMCRDSINCSWAPHSEKARLLLAIDDVVENFSRQDILGLAGE